MPKNMGASAEPTGLAGAEAPEPQSRLGPSDGIPSASARFVAPWTPSEKMWGGLARSIMMWMSFGPPHTPRTLLRHLECTGAEIPQWLLNEPEMMSLDHSMSKGTRCVLIYRAMIWDGRAEHLTPSGHTPDCEYHCEQYPHECTCGASWLPAPVRAALAASGIETRQGGNPRPRSLRRRPPRPRPERISMTDKPTDAMIEAGEEAYREGYRNGFVDATITDEGGYPDEATTLKRVSEVNLVEGWEAHRDKFYTAMHQASDTGDDDAEWFRNKWIGDHEEMWADLQKLTDRLQAKAHEGETK